MSLRLYGIDRAYFHIFKVRGRVKWKGNDFFPGEFGKNSEQRIIFMYFVAITRAID